MKLYDSAVDVVAKALRGAELPPSVAAERASIPLADMMGFLRTGSANFAPFSLAKAVGLDAAALANIETPRADIILPNGVRQWELPFEDEEVNVWSIENDGSALIIDAGFRATDIGSVVDSFSAYDLLITHPHRDHVGGYSDAALNARSIHAPVNLANASVSKPGDMFSIGPWSIEAFDLSGHHPSSLGYRIQTDGVDLVAVGDAVFARSIGGCSGQRAYQQARGNLLTMWPELKPDTILLTGHGPATTVGLETRENPFLAGWLARW